MSKVSFILTRFHGHFPKLTQKKWRKKWTVKLFLLFKKLVQQKKNFFPENNLHFSWKWNKLNAIKSIFSKVQGNSKIERIYFVELDRVGRQLHYLWRNHLSCLVDRPPSWENTNEFLPIGTKNALLPIYKNNT